MKYQIKAKTFFDRETAGVFAVDLDVLFGTIHVLLFEEFIALLP